MPEWTRYQLNNCGHRAGFPCGPKPRGVFRIVTIGSSVVMGLYVRREDTFAARLPAELSRATGREVQVYNEGLEWHTPRNIDVQFDQVLAQQPDLILWGITPWDIENVSLAVPTGRPWQRIKFAIRAAVLDRSLVGFRNLADDRTVAYTVLQHYLLLSPSEYVKQYLRQGAAADFLRDPAPRRWDANLERFERYFSDIESNAAAAHIPIAVTVFPQRVQLAMIDAGTWPKGYDPYVFGREIKCIVERHSGRYIDILHDFRNEREPEMDYYPVDGHPNAHGHEVLAHVMTQELVRSGVLR